MTSLLAIVYWTCRDHVDSTASLCDYVAAYRSVCPLQRVEIDSLYVLIRARNCQTILECGAPF